MSRIVAATETPPAAVGADSYLTLHYRVSLEPDAVDVVSTFGGKPATLQLGAGQLSPALEEQLYGLAVGAHEVFALPAGVAFGPRNPELIQRLPKALLEAESESSDYSPGDVVEFNAPGGGRYAGVFHSLEKDYAIFDFNHPLAGQPVRFEVEILGII
jgi:FKBP-type peptidyl-prolyl cis-trans isomerase SlpA